MEQTLEPSATVLMGAWVTRTVIKSKGPSCEKSTKACSWRCKNNPVVFIMGVENQFQPNEGLKFSNPLEYRAFERRFIDAGLSRGVPSSRGRVYTIPQT